MTNTTQILALTGGVGGAKLALGLSKILAPEQLTVAVNTADDFEHYGLHISPDLDTLMYTLAGLNNQQQGWGLADESWQAMSMLKQYNAESWFQLGDKDLATHLVRTQLLSQGQSLTAITQELCQQLGVQHRIIPMTDDPVRTIVNTADGELAFQHYFVREQCRPAIHGLRFEGIEKAHAQAQFMHAITSLKLSAIIICPSNPFVSVDPILALNGVQDAIKQAQVPVIAVSPIVAGMAIKGPAAKMMQELNMPSTALAVAEYYRDILDGFIIDSSDAAQAEEINNLGMVVEVMPSVMRSLEDRVTLAKGCLAFAGQLDQ